MIARTRPGSRLGIVVVAVIGWLAVTSVQPPTVSAECDGSIPSFRRFASSAEQVVIGDVTEADLTAPFTDQEGRSARFTLHVLRTVRGDAALDMSLTDLPFLTCADHLIRAGVGDRIALALAVEGIEPGVTLSTIAWIHANGPVSFTGAEHLTVAEVVASADHPTPDTSIEVIAPPRPSTGDGVGVLVVVGIVAGVAIWRRLATRAA